MTADENVKDWRSTGRKRGRRVLEEEEFPYWCRSTREGSVNREQIRTSKGDIVWVGCGRSPSQEGAPGGRFPGMGTLQVNHKNKDITDNDPVNLEWVCASCHKYLDMQTEVGVSTKGDEYGYDLMEDIVIVEEE